MKCLDLSFRKMNNHHNGNIFIFENGNGICYICGKNANQKFKTFNNINYYYCYECDLCLEKYTVNLDIKDVHFNFELLQKLTIYDLDVIPNYIYYHIGKTLKMGYTDHLRANAYRIYHKTHESARRAIREFCLYCIRYQKEVVNRDIRRKISQVIWEDKIKFC